MSRRIKKGDIRADQKYLDKWYDYQINWLNDPNFTRDKSILLPISVDIKGGIIHRNRIRVPNLQTILSNAVHLTSHGKVSQALASYIEYFQGQDGSQSSVPPSGIDFYINCPVVNIFHLPRKNWKFTDDIQFSVDNVADADLPLAFEVLGRFDEGRGLAVVNHNWTPVGEEEFSMKYNLHVSIEQTFKDTLVRTNIIIDPGSNNDVGDHTGQSFP